MIIPARVRVLCNVLFLVLVIGLPSRDNLIDCIDQPCALHIACAADLDAALGWELLVRVVVSHPINKTAAV